MENFFLEAKMRKCYACELPLPDSQFEILDFPICSKCKQDWSILLNGMQRSSRKDRCSVCRGRARHEVCICQDCAGAANVKAAAKPEQVIAPPSMDTQISDIEVWMNQAIKLAEFARQQGMDEPGHQALIVNRIGPNPVMLDDELYLRKLLSNKHIDQKRKEAIQALLKSAPKSKAISSQATNLPAPGTIDWILSEPPPLPQSVLDKINRHSELDLTGNGKAPMTSTAPKAKRRF